MTLSAGLLMGLQPQPMKPLPGVSLSGTLTESQPANPDATPGQPAKIDGSGPGVESARPASPWTRIVIHESGQPADSLDKMEARYAAKFNGCPYHFVIEADGAIRGSARWLRQEPFPDVLKPRQPGEIHVALVGTFDRNPPSAEQIGRREYLVKWLVEKFGISPDAVDVTPHANKPGRAYK